MATEANEVGDFQGHRAGRWIVPIGAAAALLPGVNGGEALVAGLLVALIIGNPFLRTTRRATHTLLAASVVGLGAGMDLGAVLRAGAGAAWDTVLGISFCLGVGLFLARMLRVSRHAGILITVGTAVCGGSAIAALVPVLRPREHDLSTALATVFLLNAVALLAFPFLGQAIGLSQHQFGLWAALAIHDTSSVVGAAMRFGPQALETATTVKLARALWIVPLTFAFARLDRGREDGTVAGKAARPWFILGFLGAAALVTFLPPLRPAGRMVASVAKQLLVLTLFLVGANLTRGALRSAGARPLLLGVALWALVAVASLAAIRAGWIG